MTDPVGVEHAYVYEPDGRLVPRGEPAAVHSDFNTITSQAVSLAKDNAVTARTGEVVDVRAATAEERAHGHVHGPGGHHH